MAEPFSPVVRGASAFTADGAKHSRNWKHLSRFLEGQFVGTASIADGAVDTGQIADGAIHDGQVSDVSVSKLTSGDFTAIAQLLGAWQVDGGTITFDASGLTMVDADGAPVFTLSPGDDPFFRGQVEAIGLLIENGLTLRGEDNFIATEGILTLSASAGNPPSAPSLQSGWDYSAIDVDPADYGLMAGLFFDSDADVWYTTTNLGENVDGMVHELANMPGLPWNRRMALAPATPNAYGVVADAFLIYVLVKHDNGHYYLRTFDKTGMTYLGQCDVESEATITISGQPGLGMTAAGQPTVVYRRGGGEVGFVKFSPEINPSLVQKFSSSGGSNPLWNTSTQLRGFMEAEGKYWVAVQGGGHSPQVRAWSTTGVYQADTTFFNGESMRGLGHDGTRFWTLSDDRIVKHTNWNWTSQSDKVWVGYTFLDDNPPASVGSITLGVEDYQTKVSPIGSITMLRRQKLTMSAPAVDTVDTGITHVRWWIERSATLPSLDYLTDVAAVDGVATQHVLEAWVHDVSVGPPSTNTFPPAEPAIVQPETLTRTHAELRGDGDGFTPVGAIIMFGGPVAPTGWLLCQGQTISRTTYADLFAAIGTAFGVGDGSTTFTLPNMQQRFPLGKAASGTGSTLGGWGGDDSHGHVVGATSQSSAVRTDVQGGGGTNANTSNHTHPVPDAEQNVTYPKFQAVNFLIKT